MNVEFILVFRLLLSLLVLLLLKLFLPSDNVHAAQASTSITHKHSQKEENQGKPKKEPYARNLDIIYSKNNYGLRAWLGIQSSGLVQRSWSMVCVECETKSRPRTAQKEVLSCHWHHSYRRLPVVCLLQTDAENTESG